MLVDETDSEKPDHEDFSENSDNVDEMSDYSAQLVCAVIFHVAVFRNLSVKKHLTVAAKTLEIKSRGNGKYELAKKVAISLVKKEFVCIQPPVNFKTLTREQIIIIKELQLPSSRATCNSSPDPSLSSSNSTQSVDETDDSLVSDPSDD